MKILHVSDSFFKLVLILVKLVKDFALLRKPKFMSLLAAKLFNKNSKRFHSKIRYRMAFDHNPLFVTYVDKLASRDYVSARIGEDYLPKIFFDAERLDQESFNKLPLNVVIKVNHLSGGVLLRHAEAPLHNFKKLEKATFPRILVPPSQLDFSLARALTDKWLASRYEYAPGSGYEWAYSKVLPRVFAEEFIDSEEGSMASDYKFFVFGNACPYFLTVIKSGDKFSKGIYNEHGKRLRAFPGESFPNGESIPINETIKTMRELALTLANGIDHLRVDFFVKANRIYVGELTPYDAGGVTVCTREYEKYAGSCWKPIWKVEK